jgi:hypothetical protein
VQPHQFFEALSSSPIQKSGTRGPHFWKNLGTKDIAGGDGAWRQLGFTSNFKSRPEVLSDLQSFKPGIPARSLHLVRPLEKDYSINRKSELCNEKLQADCTVLDMTHKFDRRFGVCVFVCSCSTTLVGADTIKTNNSVVPETLLCRHGRLFVAEVDDS